MIFALVVVCSGLLVVLAFNPVVALAERAHLAFVRHRELEAAEMRRRVAIARIQHVYNAAQQAMWEASLDTYLAEHTK